MINWELCKKLIFDSANKWYILKPEAVKEKKKTHKIPRYFEIKPLRSSSR